MLTTINPKMNENGTAERILSPFFLESSKNIFCGQHSKKFYKFFFCAVENKDSAFCCNKKNYIST
jgi:uncharacterized pyridoxamine 5'-phosphate oxidase family protein